MKKRIERIGSNNIRKFLFNRILFNRINLKYFLIFLGTTFLILASVGPQIGTRLTELKRKGVDVIIILDTSTSMDAVDVKPSRMEKAKYELSRLINNLKGDRVGLIVFAGTAHLHMPLTTDYAASKLFLNSIDTKIVVNQGTNFKDAIKLALENVGEEENKYKVLILVSDGEDHQGGISDLAEEARQKQIIIHTLGVGTTGGGPIPVAENEGTQTFKKDNSGRIITTQLNDAVLNEIAITTGGKYFRIENQANAIGPLLDELDSMEKRDMKTHIFSQYEDRYGVFLILAGICFLIEFFITTRSNKEIAWQGRFSK
ncbi:MAG: VWA domain-containing protein [Fidelibacterota bacterium]